MSVKSTGSKRLELGHENDKRLMCHHMTCNDIRYWNTSKFCKFHSDSCSRGTFISTAFCHMFQFLCPFTKCGPAITATMHICALNLYLLSSGHIHYYRWPLWTKCWVEQSSKLQLPYSSRATLRIGSCRDSWPNSFRSASTCGKWGFFLTRGVTCLAHEFEHFFTFSYIYSIFRGVW
jgi:hypothetical protein